MAGILALIPAKSNSRRLHGKNILNLHGVPLFVHSVIAALGSKRIDRVVVSSDAEEILCMAEKYGAEALARPIELCGDKITNYEVCKHVIDNCTADGCDIHTVILLQPTQPFRTVEGVDEAIEIFEEHKEFDSLVSVKKIDRLCGEVMEHAWVPVMGGWQSN